MSRGGHNWKGRGTVESARPLDVRKVARAGYLSGSNVGGWQWTSGGDRTATIGIVGGRDAIILAYRIQAHGEEAESVQQRVPIRWTPCRFGGARPWFICDVRANGVHCGRQVAKLYGAGRLFACRHCYRLGYRVQRGGPMDRAHLHLGRLHRKLNADYDGPDGLPPPRPKWMRHRTYDRVVRQIEAGEDRLDAAFTIGAERFLARVERSKQRRGMRR
jgi:hypothetical protein